MVFGHHCIDGVFIFRVYHKDRLALVTVEHDGSHRVCHPVLDEASASNGTIGHICLGEEITRISRAEFSTLCKNRMHGYLVMDDGQWFQTFVSAYCGPEDSSWVSHG